MRRQSLLLAPILCIALAMSSCCAWTHSCAEDDVIGQITTQVIDCTVDTVGSLAPHLIPAVIAIITGGAPNWKEQLDNLTGMGLDALACALQQAGQELQNFAMRAPASAPTHLMIKMKVAPSQAQKRIAEYLNAMKTADGKRVRIQFKAVTP